MTTFTDWQASRVWCADFDTAGMAHVGEYLEGVEHVTGYAYCDSAFIVDHKAGLYWTIASHGDVIGTLAECEEFLWDNHSKYEV